MCWACEEEQMQAAYRDYMAKRRAAQAAASAGEAAPAAAGGTAPADDWAKGTWFAALVDDKPEDGRE